MFCNNLTLRICWWLMTLNIGQWFKSSSRWLELFLKKFLYDETFTNFRLSLITLLYFWAPINGFGSHDSRMTIEAFGWEKYFFKNSFPIRHSLKQKLVCKQNLFSSFAVESTARGSWNQDSWCGKYTDCDFNSAAGRSCTTESERWVFHGHFLYKFNINLGKLNFLTSERIPKIISCYESTVSGINDWKHLL